MVQETRRLRFVYYCSGHGYGHATRVSAFAGHLLSLNPQPIVHIVSSAPKHVFADSIALGALYRYAEIDPVIVQPLAYRVDRQKSVQVLRSFLQKKHSKTLQEQDWLRAVNADCVLSDAAFLGCVAANAAGIPSVLITNFSFDSVYSYLSTSYVDQDDNSQPANSDMLEVAIMQRDEYFPDIPIRLDELQPLVDEILKGYRCADLLMRLPGAIPIPSFPVQPSLPSAEWIDLEQRTFRRQVTSHLLDEPSEYQLHPQIPFPSEHGHKVLPRTVIPAPLLVRSPDPSVYTSEGRSRILSSIGVPLHLHDHNTTRIVLVSFGGQVFHKPHSRSHSRCCSNTGTPEASSFPGYKHTIPNGGTLEGMPSKDEINADALSEALTSTLLEPHPQHRSQSRLRSPPMPPPPPPPRLPIPEPLQNGGSRINASTLSRVGSLRLKIAGAPPTTIISTSPSLPTLPHVPTFSAITIPPTPTPSKDKDCDPFTKVHIGIEINGESKENAEVGISVNGEIGMMNGEKGDGEEGIPRMFPDENWLAIVCGVSKEWGREDGEELPDNFFVAPRDVYMPDLTAVADVLLGKLGYGTVSECVDACTPFVFVPRPLFIEEFGLRLLLERDGVGVELSRTSYEAGEWADAIEEAYIKGKEAKMKKRLEGETGKRKAEGREMARTVVDWVERWKRGGDEC